jgi:glyoxylate reductase
MRPTAILINTARGPVVDEQALYQALTAGRIAAAGLDVFEIEPLPPESPLIGLDNVVLAPHIGSATHATRARMADLAAENCVAVLTGRWPPNPVNPEVLVESRESRVEG